MSELLTSNPESDYERMAKMIMETPRKTEVATKQRLLPEGIYWERCQCGVVRITMDSTSINGGQIGWGCPRCNLARAEKAERGAAETKAEPSREQIYRAALELIQADRNENNHPARDKADLISVAVLAIRGADRLAEKTEVPR